MRFLVVSDFHLRIPGNNELLEFSGIRKYCEEQYGYCDKYRFPDGFTVNDDKEYDEDAVKKYLHSERGKFVFHQKNCLASLINKIIDLNPDFLFILGDTFKSINFNGKSKLSYNEYQRYYNIDKYNIIDIFKYNLTKLSLNKIKVYILTGNHDYENVDFWSNFSDVPNVQIVISEKDKIITHYYLENNRAFAFWLMPYVPATNAYDRCMAVKNLLTDVNLRFKGKFCFNFLFGHQSVDIHSTIDLKDPDFYRKKEHCTDDYSAPINEELCVDFEASFFGHCHFSNQWSTYHYGNRSYIYFVDQTIKQDCDAKFSLGTIWCCDCNTESDSPKLCIYEVRF